MEEVDSLKKMNKDAQAEISQLKKLSNNLNWQSEISREKILESDFKKALEEKILKLEADLSKSSLIFNVIPRNSNIILHWRSNGRSDVRTLAFEWISERSNGNSKNEK